MRFIDKVYNKLGYKMLNMRLPIFIIIGIYLIEKNHIYMDKEFIKYLNILKVLSGNNRILITGTGVFIIFFKNKIIKFPMGEHSYLSLGREYANYLLLKRSNLNSMVDYVLEDNNNYYMMELLLNCKHFLNYTNWIYSELSKTNVGNIQLEILLNNDIFTNALSYINKEDNSFLTEEILALLKSKKTVKTYAMHGDLTQYNIMKNSKGHIVLIDLDRFTFEGIENIDRIHFAVEYYAKKRGKDFFVIIEHILKNKNISEKYFYFLFFYFIYRIGVEYDVNVKLPFSYRKKMSKLIELFLVKYKEVK